MKPQVEVAERTAQASLSRDQDTITELCGATVQHGPLNRRVYLMSMNDADPRRVIEAMEQLAADASYTKIFAKVNKRIAAPFTEAGYVPEALVPGYFGGAEDAWFLCKYLDPARSKEASLPKIRTLVEEAVTAAGTPRSTIPPLPTDMHLRPCVPDDVEAMAALYKKVFPTYPFPIHDPAYLLSTMETHVRYYCIERRGYLFALSSAETDMHHKVAEVTDFAVDPVFRGIGAAGRLLAEMEKKMRAERMNVLYTIARAQSVPINRTFARAGYAFGGILVNNTHIGGQIESMTVWYKSLP